MPKLNAVACLIIVYSVGIIGMLTPYRDSFILLTPFTLIASMAFLIWGEEKRHERLYIGLGLAAFFGWLIEALGTNTGAIFGAYTYGPTLGWHIWNTPFTMALNWASLIYCTTLIAKEIGFKPKFERLGVSIIGATLMVFLDFFLEPVAIRYNFWAWQENSNNLFLVAPWKNYTSWWLISFIFIISLYPFFKNCKNSAAWVLFLLQFIFFMALNFI